MCFFWWEIVSVWVCVSVCVFVSGWASVWVIFVLAVEGIYQAAIKRSYQLLTSPHHYLFAWLEISRYESPANKCLDLSCQPTYKWMDKLLLRRKNLGQVFYFGNLCLSCTEFTFQLLHAGEQSKSKSCSYSAPWTKQPPGDRKVHSQDWSRGSPPSRRVLYKWKIRLYGWIGVMLWL